MSASIDQTHRSEGRWSHPGTIIVADCLRFVDRNGVEIAALRVDPKSRIVTFDVGYAGHGSVTLASYANEAEIHLDDGGRDLPEGGGQEHAAISLNVTAAQHGDAPAAAHCSMAMKFAEEESPESIWSWGEAPAGLVTS